MQKLFFVLLACFSLVLTSCGGGGGGSSSADESAVSIKFSTGGSSRSARAAFSVSAGDTIYVFLTGDFVGYGKATASNPGSTTVTIKNVPVGANVTAYAVVGTPLTTVRIGHSAKTTITSGGTTISISDAETIQNTSFSISSQSGVPNPDGYGYVNVYTLSKPSIEGVSFSHVWHCGSGSEDSFTRTEEQCVLGDESGYSVLKCVVTMTFPGGGPTFEIYP